jgi:hypothetical protein
MFFLAQSSNDGDQELQHDGGSVRQRRKSSGENGATLILTSDRQASPSDQFVNRRPSAKSESSFSRSFKLLSAAAATPLPLFAHFLVSRVRWCVSSCLEAYCAFFAICQAGTSDHIALQKRLVHGVQSRQDHSIEKQYNPTLFDVAHIMELKYQSQVVLNAHRKQWECTRAELSYYENVYQDYQEQLLLLSPETRPSYYHILKAVDAEVEMRRKRELSIWRKAQEENACRVLFHQLEVRAR